VEAGNPEGAADEAPVDPASWVKLELTLSNPDDTVNVVLLRPRVWAESLGARAGAYIPLDLPEMGASGPALVTAVGPCPPLKAGGGRVVTGTFRHRSARILDLAVEGSIEPIGVTVNHPFWSEDRQRFVPAGALRPGERLRTLEGEARVASLVQRAGEQAVYNIEVQTEHVYRVTTSGILVHNTYGEASVDVNALINAIEKGEMAALDRALAGRAPVVPITAAKEFLKRGDVSSLRSFLTARGGRIGAAGSASAIATLQQMATAAGRVLKSKDAAVVASALKDGLPVITRDSKLLRFLQNVIGPAAGEIY
jgi:hypothetical protein